jgi:hypothetical protein
MDGIITIIILFFVISSVTKLFKKTAQPAKKPMTQAQTEATKPRPVVKPVIQQNDYRFPVKPKAAPAPVAQEGRDPDEELSEYSPITPSAEIDKQFSTFSNYKGSLNAPNTEGPDQPKAYEPAAVPYRTDSDGKVKVLPDVFNRDALVQAVVMREILNRPRARR